MEITTPCNFFVLKANGKEYRGSYMLPLSEAKRRHQRTYENTSYGTVYWEAAYPELLPAH